MTHDVMPKTTQPRAVDDDHNCSGSALGAPERRGSGENREEQVTATEQAAAGAQEATAAQEASATQVASAAQEAAADQDENQHLGTLLVAESIIENKIHSNPAPGLPKHGEGYGALLQSEHEHQMDSQQSEDQETTLERPPNDDNHKEENTGSAEEKIVDMPSAQEEHIQAETKSESTGPLLRERETTDALVVESIPELWTLAWALKNGVTLAGRLESGRSDHGGTCHPIFFVTVEAAIGAAEWTTSAPRLLEGQAHPSVMAIYFDSRDLDDASPFVDFMDPFEGRLPTM